MKQDNTLPALAGTLVEIVPNGKRFRAVTLANKDLTEFVRPWMRKNAFQNDMCLELVATKTGGYQWRKVDKSKFRIPTTMATPLPSERLAMAVDEPKMTHDEIINFIKLSPAKKPTHLVISDMKWKYLIRSTTRGKNILLTGPSGCGKTLATQCVQAVMDRPSFYFNLGATQDPRSTLIGNTHFRKEEGTFFSQSLFVTAINTPHAIIMLDEISRAHPDAWNILMTVLDEGQRYLRLDEKEDSPTIAVAPGVTFIATANVGMEYTSTRIMDRALLDRFVIIEMEPLEQQEEFDLLRKMFPEVAEQELKAIAEVASHTREQVKSDDPKVNSIISTRASVEMASLIYDGFSLAEVAEVCIYPFFSNSGGLESERTYMRQYVQKLIPAGSSSTTPW